METKIIIARIIACTIISLIVYFFCIKYKRRIEHEAIDLRRRLEKEFKESIRKEVFYRLGRGRRIVQWKDFADKAPLPHYIPLDASIEITSNENENYFIGRGICFFPSSDPTIKTRNMRINHIQVITLFIDVYLSMNLAWNVANIFKQENDWEVMLAKKVVSDISTPLTPDTEFEFEFEFELERKKLVVTDFNIVIRDKDQDLTQNKVRAYIKEKI